MTENICPRFVTVMRCVFRCHAYLQHGWTFGTFHKLNLIAQARQFTHEPLDRRSASSRFAAEHEEVLGQHMLWTRTLALERKNTGWFFCFKPVSLACCSLSATVGGKQLSPVLSQREGIWTGMFDEPERANTLGCLLYVKAAPAVSLWSLYNKRALQEGGRRRWPSVSQPAAQPACKTD